MSEFERRNFWRVDPRDWLPRETKEEHVAIDSGNSNKSRGSVSNRNADGKSNHGRGHCHGSEHQDLPTTEAFNKPDWRKSSNPEHECVESGQESTLLIIKMKAGLEQNIEIVDCERDAGENLEKLEHDTEHNSPSGFDFSGIMDDMAPIEPLRFAALFQLSNLEDGGSGGLDNRMVDRNIAKSRNNKISRINASFDVQPPWRLGQEHNRTQCGNCEYTLDCYRDTPNDTA